MMAILFWPHCVNRPERDQNWSDAGSIRPILIMFWHITVDIESVKTLSVEKRRESSMEMGLVILVCSYFNGRHYWRVNHTVWDGWVGKRWGLGLSIWSQPLIHHTQVWGIFPCRKLLNVWFESDFENPACYPWCSTGVVLGILLQACRDTWWVFFCMLMNGCYIWCSTPTEYSLLRHSCYSSIRIW